MVMCCRKRVSTLSELTDRFSSSGASPTREGCVASTSVELSQNPPRRPWSVFADSPTRTVLLGFLLILATFAVYSQVRSHPFFELDDAFYVVDNVHVHNGLDWTTVSWAFTSLSMENWIPLSFLFHALNYWLFGPNPAGHHLTNALLHALNAALLFWVLKRAT